MEPKNKPTLGRQVRFGYNGVELTATICHVHSDTCVNLSVIDREGRQFSFTSAFLADPAPEMPNNEVHGQWWWPVFNK